MKKILLLFFSLVAAMSASAQSYYDFTNEYNGTTLYYKITDNVNHYVAFVSPAPASYYPPYQTLTTFPATAEYNGITYAVKTLGSNAFVGGNATEFHIPEGVEDISDAPFLFAQYETLYLPTTMKQIYFGEYFGKKIVGLENTQIEELGDGTFNQCYQLEQDWVFPPTLRTMGERALMYHSADKDITFPASLTSISITPWYGWDYSPGRFPAFTTVTFNNPTPATVTDIYTGSSMSTMFGTSVTEVFVPADATNAYETATNWNYYAGKYREKLTIGPNGYTTYYLENENFLVPTGCTAYIIEGSVMRPGEEHLADAVVKTIPAGSIIPRQTGFILGGTPNATVTYQANVSGVEVDVTNNLMVGTATEREFSEAGYRFYIFGKGAKGQGFYQQGTREGESIRLKAHKAGLRLPIAGGNAPSKSFFFDFDEAIRNATTGIRSVSTDTDNAGGAVYDLQGRRVTNPSRGVYIVNGKKVVK